MKQKLDSDKLIVIAAATAALVFGVLYFVGGRGGGVELTRAGEQAAIVADIAIDMGDVIAPVAEVTVHVAGAVNKPGVYRLDSGSRVQDALDMAGGPTDEADLNRINLAAFLKDAQQVLIPAESAAYETGYASDAYAAADGRVNINTAGLRELITLPGIGEVIAGNIVAYREKNGPFAQVADIKNVPRIGDRTFENIRELIIAD